MRRRVTVVEAVVSVSVVAMLLAGCNDPADKLQSPDPDEQVRAIHELHGEKGTEVVASLEEAAARKDTAVAVEAVWVLSCVEEPRARSALREIVGREPRAMVRHAAVQALGGVGGQGGKADEESVEVLRRVARSDPDQRVRAEAAAGIGRVGTLEDVRFLADIATTDSSVQVQSRAVGAIERLLGGLRFNFNPRAPQEERSERLAVVAQLAPAIAEKYKGRSGRTGP